MNWERYQQGCPSCGLTIHETSWSQYGCEDCDQCIDEQYGEDMAEMDRGDQMRLHEKESDL